jgi:hypothetical protein
MSFQTVRHRIILGLWTVSLLCLAMRIILYFSLGISDSKILSYVSTWGVYKYLGYVVLSVLAAAGAICAIVLLAALLVLLVPAAFALFPYALLVIAVLFHFWELVPAAAILLTISHYVLYRATRSRLFRRIYRLLFVPILRRTKRAYQILTWAPSYRLPREAELRERRSIALAYAREEELDLQTYTGQKDPKSADLSPHDREKVRLVKNQYADNFRELYK